MEESESETESKSNGESESENEDPFDKACGVDWDDVIEVAQGNDSNQYIVVDLLPNHSQSEGCPTTLRLMNALGEATIPIESKDWRKVHSGQGQEANEAREEAMKDEKGEGSASEERKRTRWQQIANARRLIVRERPKQETHVRSGRTRKGDAKVCREETNVNQNNPYEKTGGESGPAGVKEDCGQKENLQKGVQGSIQETARTGSDPEEGRAETEGIRTGSDVQRGKKQGPTSTGKAHRGGYTSSMAGGGCPSWLEHKVRSHPDAGIEKWCRPAEIIAGVRYSNKRRKAISATGRTMIILAGAKTGGDSGTKCQASKRREGQDRAAATIARRKIRAMTGQGEKEEWPVTVEIEEMIIPSTVPVGTGKHKLKRKRTEKVQISKTSDKEQEGPGNGAQPTVDISGAGPHQGEG